MPEGHTAVAAGQLLRKTVNAPINKGSLPATDSLSKLRTETRWVTFHYGLALAVPASLIGIATGVNILHGGMSTAALQI